MATYDDQPGGFSAIMGVLMAWHHRGAHGLGFSCWEGLQGHHAFFISSSDVGIVGISGGLREGVQASMWPALKIRRRDSQQGGEDRVHKLPVASAH